MIVRGLAVLFAVLAVSSLPTHAETLVDSTGRRVVVPSSPKRLLAAGPPAATLLYVLAPQAMLGWVRPPKDAEKSYLLPSAAELPVLGRLTGHGEASDLGWLKPLQPDRIVDLGTVADPYRALADRVQAETGIPYLLIDGRLDETPAALRRLGQLLEVAARGEVLAQFAEAMLRAADETIAAVPAARRPRIYLAYGPTGLETRARGTINTELIERVGAINVAGDRQGTGGRRQPSLQQIIDWAPDTIIAFDPAAAAAIRRDRAWQAVPAVAEGRVLLQPSLPFGFVDDPPSVNRLIGVTWLLHQVYPTVAKGDLGAEVRAFYKLFYQVDLDTAAVDRVLREPGD